MTYTNFFSHVESALPNTIFPGSTGEADHISQAFTYRMTAKDYVRADHPYRLKQAPPDYDASKYSWHGNREPFIPNRKFDLLGINWGGDLTGFGTRWVLADTNKEAYRFRPDDLITLGEFAQMVVNGLQIPLSITGAHFVDAPRGHPSFKYIKTLYDNSTQSLNPYFKYNIQPEISKVFAHPGQHVDLGHG